MSHGLKGYDMNPFSINALASLILLARSVGRPTAIRALTPSQSTIRSFPGRRNQDVVEIQNQFAQTAEQVLQSAEAVFDPNWTDPDIAVHADDAFTAALKANLAAND